MYQQQSIDYMGQDNRFGVRMLTEIKNNLNLSQRQKNDPRQKNLTLIVVLKKENITSEISIPIIWTKNL